MRRRGFHRWQLPGVREVCYALFLPSLSVIVVVLVGSFVAWGSGASAQEPFATPGPGEFEAAPGLIGRELAKASSRRRPPGRLLGVLRVTSAPGSVFTGGETTLRSASFWWSRGN